MRLIDADALKDGYMHMGYDPNEHPEDSYMEGWCKGFNAAVDHCIGHVIHAPTIEPERKTGKWIERNPQNSDRCRLIECDQCGFSHIVGFNVPYEDWIENRNFCERCGADMRKAGDQT